MVMGELLETLDNNGFEIQVYEDDIVKVILVREKFEHFGQITNGAEHPGQIV